MIETPIDPRRWPSYQTVAGQPKPEHHAFYPTTAARKFHHHRPGATELAAPPAEIPRGYRGLQQVTPAPAGTLFRFRVDFENLRTEELALLTYCLVLEDEVTVVLGPAALGRTDGTSLAIRGPLRHKLGGAKPLGGGSVHIQVESLRLCVDPTSRYRAGAPKPLVLEGDALRLRLAELTEPVCQRQDPTMANLRAILIYAEDDPRAKNLAYPSKWWFDEHNETRLKPTLDPPTPMSSGD
jgi:hypothetical protein